MNPNGRPVGTLLTAFGLYCLLTARCLQLQLLPDGGCQYACRPPLRSGSLGDAGEGEERMLRIGHADLSSATLRVLVL